MTSYTFAAALTGGGKGGWGSTNAKQDSNTFLQHFYVSVTRHNHIQQEI